jgi:hypothetical protein
MSEEQKALQEANIAMLEGQYKWSWAKAGIGLWKNSIGAREFWFFAIITWQIQQRFAAGVENPTYWISYCAVGICFIFHKAIENALYNMKLSAEAKLALAKEFKETKNA